MAGSVTKRAPERQRDKANRVMFTELGLGKLKAPASGQELYWDAKTIGLSLLVSSGRGTKTYRSTFNLHGEYVSRKIGRFGEMTLAEAREQTEKDRREAAKGIDPREVKQRALTLYSEIVDEFITHWAKPRQRTWDQTERVLKVTCSPWLKKPMASITKQDALALLRGFVTDGHPYKARITQRWLKTLWKWAWKNDYVETDMMAKVEVEIETGPRERVYSDAEIKTIWQAADKLDNPAEGAFIKLIVLLAPRKTALACLHRSDLDNADNPTLWTTPHELTKSRKRAKDRKRVYITPLPPLAQRIIKGLPKSEDGRLFPSLPVHELKTGQRKLDGVPLARELAKLGAPKDFAYHVARHTIATWLENEGHSEWERGLVLNHAGGGSVTGDYSHGFAGKLKLELLTKWSDHVEGLVKPEGVALLR